MDFLNKSSKNLINDFGDQFFLLIIVLISVGFLICKCLKSGFSVQEFHPFEKSEDMLDNGSDESGNIGLEPIPRRQDKVPPSLETESLSPAR